MVDLSLIVQARAALAARGASLDTKCHPFVLVCKPYVPANTLRAVGERPAGSIANHTPSAPGRQREARLPASIAISSSDSSQIANVLSPRSSTSWTLIRCQSARSAAVGGRDCAGRGGVDLNRARPIAGAIGDVGLLSPLIESGGFPFREAGSLVGSGFCPARPPVARGPGFVLPFHLGFPAVATSRSSPGRRLAPKLRPELERFCRGYPVATGVRSRTRAVGFLFSQSATLLDAWGHMV